MTFPSGNKYEGNFINDKFEGRGVLTFADGDKFEGEWKNGNA